MSRFLHLPCTTKPLGALLLATAALLTACGNAPAMHSASAAPTGATAKPPTTRSITAHGACNVFTGQQIGTIMGDATLSGVPQSVHNQGETICVYQVGLRELRVLLFVPSSQAKQFVQLKQEMRLLPQNVKRTGKSGNIVATWGAGDPWSVTAMLPNRYVLGLQIVSYNSHQALPVVNAMWSAMADVYAAA